VKKIIGKYVLRLLSGYLDEQKRISRRIAFANQFENIENDFGYKKLMFYMRFLDFKIDTCFVILFEFIYKNDIQGRKQVEHLLRKSDENS
jgi:hypothetical protein